MPSRMATAGPANPPWVMNFVSQGYFGKCEDKHSHACSKNAKVGTDSTKKADKNLFCISCNKGPLCATEKKANHNGHLVLQVRKASNSDAVRVEDIDQLIDIRGVQVYSINGAKIVFLPSRPQDKRPKGSPMYCKGCERSLQDSHNEFCSISCKLQLFQSPVSPISVIPPEVIQLEDFSPAYAVTLSPVTDDCDQEGLLDAVHKRKCDNASLGQEGSTRKRSRRKGIPCRAPLQ